MASKRQIRSKIALLAVGDPRDRSSWSGAHHSMFWALQKHCGDVVSLGPVEPRFKGLLNLANKLLTRLGLPPIKLRYTANTARRYAAIFQRKLAGEPFDFIFAPTASVELMEIETELPVVLR